MPFKNGQKVVNPNWRKNLLIGRTGIPHTEETKKKMSESRKKYFLEHPELREIISKAHKGKKCPHKGYSWHKDEKDLIRHKHFCKWCKKEFSTIQTKRSFCCRQCWREWFAQKTKGSGHWNWKGGVTPELLRERSKESVRIWRKAIFEKYNYTCQKCHKSGGTLNAHHINSFKDNVALRTCIENGILLCEYCHHTFHKKFGQTYNTKEQLEKFLRC